MAVWVVARAMEIKKKIHQNIPIDCGDLVVRRYKLKDIIQYFNLVNDDEMIKYLHSRNLRRYPAVETFLLGIINGYSLSLETRFAIASKEGDELLGCISMYPDNKGNVELGYWIGRKYWGRGYMTRIMKATLDMLSSIGCVSTVSLKIHKDNKRSLRVAQKNGFEEVYNGVDIVKLVKTL